MYCDIDECKNDNFQMKKIHNFLIFANNKDCALIEAVKTSTHNLCITTKIMYTP